MNWRPIVEYLVAHPDSTQLFLFGFILTSLWVAERIYRPQSTLSKLKHTGINVAFMSGALPVQLLMMTVCIAASTWVTANHFGLLYLFPNPENPWLKYVAMFLVLDFLDYVYHYTSHHVPFIWRLHLVHHTDEAVDVSTTFREHPAETLVRVAFLTLWVIICGASIQVLILRQTAETFSNVLQHMKFRLPPLTGRVLGWLFVTPNLHHTHHHFQMPGTNCNYGDVFSVWDRIFGTFVELRDEEPVFGLDSHPGQSGKILQLLGLGRLVQWTAARQ